MKYSALLSDVALALVERGDFGSRMNTALAKLGVFMKASRVWVIQGRADRGAARLTYEWCAQGVAPRAEGRRELSRDEMDAIRRILVEEGRIYSADARILPDGIRTILAPEGVRSLLVYPLCDGSECAGLLGFDELGRIRQWNDNELSILKTASAIISTALDHEAALDGLRATEDNYLSFFDTIDDLIVIGDMGGTILYTNAAVRRKLGFSEQELRNMPILGLHPEPSRAAAADVLGAMFRKERNVCPLQLRIKGGGELSVETRIWFGRWNGAEAIFGISKDLSVEQEALQRFTKLFESNPALMAITDAQTNTFVDVNESFLRKLGYARSEVIGRTSEELVLFADPRMQHRIASELASEGRIRDVEMEIRRKDGKTLDGFFSGEVIDNQGIKYFLTVMVDITEQTELRRRLDSERKRLGNIIEGTRLGTWEWNVKTGETVFNERWAEIAGYTLAELEPVTIATWERLAHPDDLAESARLLGEHFSGKSEYYDFDTRMRHKDGRWIWIQDRGKVIEWDAEGKPLRMFGTHADITEKKELEERIRQIAIRDPLTEIYNRRYIFERLEEMAAEYTRQGRNFCVSILDLDHFKLVNDTYGHQCGDFVLKQFAAILASSVRPYDLVGRYGGEEFVVVSANSTAKDAATAIGRILERFRGNSHAWGEAEIRSTFSGGIADSSEFSRQEISIEKMVAAADRRLYAAKEAGRNRLVASDAI